MSMEGLQENSTSTMNYDELVNVEDPFYRSQLNFIWKQLVGIAHLEPQEVMQRADEISEVAREIFLTESQKLNPSTKKDRNEIAQVFRDAAKIILSFANDDSILSDFVAPMLGRAKDIENDREP